MYPLKIAIDAQIMMKNHARRMVLGAAECAGTAVIIPDTAATMAKLHYHKVAARYVEKSIVWSTVAKNEPIDEETLGLQIQDRLDKTTQGFADWLDNEQQRNNGLFERAPRTRKTQGVARELSMHGVVDDPADTRWEFGEDPYMIAEALEAGAHWIASDNFGTLRPHAMEDWLNRVQSEGRYTHVPRPFILSGPQALDTMLEQTTGWNENPRERGPQRIALAHALSEPNDPRTPIGHRIAILGRFASDLRDCGMSVAGKDLERWQTRMYANLEHGREDEVWHEIEQMRDLRPTKDVDRTRRAEDRRMSYETGTIATTHQEQRQPSRPGAIGP